jgi:membrane protease YdiL (CAAX protease family)
LNGGRSTRVVLVAAVMLLAVVDAALITRGHLLAGAVAEAVLLVFLLNAAGWHHRASGAAQSAMRALALLALARLVAAGMPISDVSEPAAQLMVAVPVGYAALRFAPLAGLSVRLFSPSSVLGRRERVLTDTGVVLAGAGLGLLAYELDAPALATAESSSGRIAAAALAVTVTVVVEELVFRGVVQSALQRIAGRLGAVAATALFACAYLGGGPAAVVLTIAAAGAVFAYGFARSGNLYGAIAGHFALALGAFVVWPVLLG